MNSGRVFATRRAYEMTRDGFTLLAMGFIGPKALKFKMAYIKAFNEAIEALKKLEKGRIATRRVEEYLPFLPLQ